MRQSYRRLAVWEKAMDLVARSYALANQLPAIERFQLAAQIRSASVSVASNIAEGHGRLHPAEFVRFLAMASGSLRELESQIQITVRVGFIAPESAEPVLSLADEVGRMSRA